MVASISSSTVSKWADSVFSKLDTKNQGYIEKSDLQAALSNAGAAGNGKGAVNVDDTFSALDGDSDGKVTKSELTDAMSKLSDQLNAQFDASRVAHGGRGGPPPEGPPPAGQDGGNAAGASSTSSTSTDYIAAADTDGDGTVSDAEQAAYDKKLASGQADGSSSSSDSASGGTGQAHRKDPARELAHALNLLKAYAENGGDSSTAPTGNTDSTSSVSVEA